MTISSLSVRQKTLLLVLIPAICELGLLCMLSVLLDASERDVYREAHAKRMVSVLDTMSRSLYGGARSLFLYAATKAPTPLEQFDKECMSTLDAMQRLHELSAGDQREQIMAEKLIESGSQVYMDLSLARRIANRNDFAATNKKYDIFQQFNSDSRALNEQIADMVNYEHSVEAGSTRGDTYQSIIRTLLAGAIATPLLAAILTIYFNRTVYARLSILIDNTVRFVKRQPLHPRIAGTDEISKVDSAFHEAHDAIRLAQNQREQVVAMVSHDLKAPLSAVGISMSALLSGRKGPIDEKARAEIERTSRTVDRCMLLIADLLDNEKINHGSLALNVRPVRISEMIERSIESVQPLAQEKSIQIDCTEKSSAIASADAGRLMQVLVNVLSNAIKYSPSGTTVRIEPVSHADTVTIAIEDSGRGIPDSAKATIFDRFSQVQPTDAELGSGLGLSISKELIEQMGGSIVVADREGGGTVFKISLALANVQGRTESGLAAKDAHKAKIE